MKNLLKIIIIILTTQTSNIAQNNIWVVSNIELDDHLISSEILSHPERSKDDILVVHGNALISKNTGDINQSVNRIREYFDRVYLIPGDKDWDDYSSKNLKSLGDFLDDRFKGDVIVPENGCGAIEVKEIDDNLALVFVDSEWYFRNWQDDGFLNKECEVKSRTGFWSELNGDIGKLKAKQIILFARHPITRYDESGGNYSTVNQIFPLSNVIPGLYIPLPIIGTIISDTKHYFTPRSTIISPLYQTYVSQVETLLENHPEICLVSSDSYLNYVEQFKDNFLININSSRKMDVRTDDELLYQSNTRGILRLEVDSSDVNAHMFNGYNRREATIKVVDSRPLADRIDSIYMNNEVAIEPIITRTIRKEEDMVHFNGLIFGKLNKRFYLKEVTVPQLDLTKEKGGLYPVRLGGGQQTQSLRLADRNGQIYLARSLKKRPEKALPENLDYDIIVPLMDNFFYAGQPLGGLATPVLDSAIGVYHITPKLMYLPNQKRLGIYNSEIGGEMVLFRERADNAWVNKKSFGYSEDIIGSKDMISEMNNNDGIPHKEEYLRARLLDLVVGDWDRHQDQWRWAKDTADNKIDIYHPIARDRDQVFANFDGLLLNMARPYSRDMLQLRKYDENLTRSDLRWMHWKSSFLDNTVLHFFNEEEWNEQTATVKSILKDDLLQEAVDRLPKSYGDERDRLKQVMKARVNQLDQISEDFRMELLNHGLVRASDDADSIIITQYEDRIQIKVIADYAGNERNIKFDGSFYEKWTDRVWVYGLEGRDIFEFRGESKSCVDLTVIGGYDRDTYYSKTKMRNITIIDDNSEESISKNTDIEYRLITDKTIHELTRFDLVPQHKFLLPSFGYNTDDGFKVGGQYTWNNTRFKSNNSHTIGASYLTNRSSSQFFYKYRSFDKLTQKGSYANAYWSGPRRQLSYYGGNSSTNNEETEYYDVSLKDYKVEYGNLKKLNTITEINYGAYGWNVKIDKETEKGEDRYINIPGIIDPDGFNNQYFLGGKVGIELKNFDDVFKPIEGARLKLGTNYRYDFKNKSSNIKLVFEYDYYKLLVKNERLIYSTKVRANHMFGDYYIYEGFQLGGTDLLRGSINGRYTGRTLLAQNNNLHLKIFNEVSESYFPVSCGVSGSFDHGRVWADNEDSNDWHYSYGGGIWVSPLDKFLISTSYHQSDEDSYQIRLLFNWQF